MPITLRLIAVAGAWLLGGAAVSAVCVDWRSSGRFADIEAAAVIFEGTVERIDPDLSTPCAPDRVVFRVRRVWKGAVQPQYVLLQTTERTHDFISPEGLRGVQGCPSWTEEDTFYERKSYIVFAAGPVERLESLGCGVSRRPSANTRRRLDAWTAQASRRK